MPAISTLPVRAAVDGWTLYVTVPVPFPLAGGTRVIHGENEAALQAHPASVLTVTVPGPPALETVALVGLSENEHAIDVVVVVRTDVVGGGGVGSGALGSDRSIEMHANANVLGEHVLVPGGPPANVRALVVIAPEKSRSALHPAGVFAFRFPSNSPPVSSGFDAPPSSPSTVPIVPLPITKTPVTLYTFSVNRAASKIGRGPLAAGAVAGAPVSNSKNRVISDGTLAGGVGKAL